MAGEIKGFWLERRTDLIISSRSPYHHLTANNATKKKKKKKKKKGPGRSCILLFGFYLTLSAYCNLAYF
jgi:hypothetical protein